jgi:uncharacterized protein (TIGR02452 family)
MFRPLWRGHKSSLNIGNAQNILSLRRHRFRPLMDISTPIQPKPRDPRDTGRDELRAIAKATIEILEAGHYTAEGVKYDLRPQLGAMISGTRYYTPDCDLSDWSQPTPTNTSARSRPTGIEIVEISTLGAADHLCSTPYTSPEETRRRVGVLNFACAKHPGGGFRSGARAQEESIARSSTLYSSLITPTAENFYNLHKKDPEGGYYSHAMVFSPDVTVFRTDDGELVAPTQIEVVTSPAVNARVVRQAVKGRDAREAEEVKIGNVMKERMGRILFLFEKHGIKDIVLGSFGTGAFQNKISLIAAIWAELLAAPGARFANSFDRVVFAILGHQTVVEFKDTFEERQGRK